ncbi:MAG: ubiquinone/menaquinone biosynthesis C-methylase UbiE [Limisphaerales bacterium]|jgi:ubiquinone/menaquinone biosynthesis C-methylase UbiE
MDYLTHNKNTWNAKTPIHVKSDFYNNESFLKGRNTLIDIELKLLGDLKGKSILHLQCHFGQDTISLARMGASVTGIDLSDKAIAQAQEFATQTGADAEFICCNIYDLPKILDKKFDIVFTSYGVIGWLPDMKKWSEIVSHFLKPKGQFIMAEFHPTLWMFDDDFTKVEYGYFNSGPIEEVYEGTYADFNSAVKTTTVCWNHSLADVLGNLLAQGLMLDHFEEFDYSPYPCFKEVEEFEPGKYRIPTMGNKIPMIYALTATKK